MNEINSSTKIIYITSIRTAQRLMKLPSTSDVSETVREIWSRSNFVFLTSNWETLVICSIASFLWGLVRHRLAVNMWKIGRRKAVNIRRCCTFEATLCRRHAPHPPTWASYCLEYLMTRETKIRSWTMLVELGVFS